MDAIWNVLLEIKRVFLDSGSIYSYLFFIYLALISSEYIGRLIKFGNKSIDYKDGRANLVIVGAYFVFDTFIGKLLPLALYVYIHQNFALFSLENVWWVWLMAYLLHELYWYWLHRWSHEVAFFWAWHHVHHSSKEYDYTVASRGSVFDHLNPADSLVYVMALIGIPFEMFIAVSTVMRVVGIIYHTRLVDKMGFLEHIFITPSHHRVHHGTELKYLDKNYGLSLVWIDKLFGTFQPEEEEPTYGLLTDIDTYNPLRIQTAGFEWLWKQMESADRLSDKLRYLYMPPGWRHDENSATVKELRERELAQQALA